MFGTTPAPARPQSHASAISPSTRNANNQLVGILGGQLNAWPDRQRATSTATRQQRNVSGIFAAASSAGSTGPSGIPVRRSASGLRRRNVRRRSGRNQRDWDADPRIRRDRRRHRERQRPPARLHRASSCQMVHAGGLVGMNTGTIVSSPASFATFATGPVTVGRHERVGGGLVGFNSTQGFITTRKATGHGDRSVRAVRVVGGLQRLTTLGGLVGDEPGLRSLNVAGDRKRWLAGVEPPDGRRPRRQQQRHHRLTHRHRQRRAGNFSEAGGSSSGTRRLATATIGDGLASATHSLLDRERHRSRVGRRASPAASPVRQLHRRQRMRSARSPAAAIRSLAALSACTTSTA